MQKTRCRQSHEDLAVGVGNITQMKRKENLGLAKIFIGVFSIRCFGKAAWIFWLTQDNDNESGVILMVFSFLTERQLCSGKTVNEGTAIQDEAID